MLRILPVRTQLNTHTHTHTHTHQKPTCSLMNFMTFTVSFTSTRIYSCSAMEDGAPAWASSNIQTGMKGSCFRPKQQMTKKRSFVPCFTSKGRRGETETHRDNPKITLYFSQTTAGAFLNTRRRSLNASFLTCVTVWRHFFGLLLRWNTRWIIW